MELSTIIRALSEGTDYVTVSDYASEYGEPGYSTTGPILLGNYWCHCDHGPDADKENARAAERGTPPRYLHAIDYHYPRIFRALEDAGAEFEWSDEWVVVDGKAYRTEADSYSWEATAVLNPDTCEYMTPDSDPSEWLEFAVNDSSRCLMSDTLSDEQLSAEGFEERQCDYESGWYGKEDRPDDIFAAIKEREPASDILFKLSGVEQFRITFCVYVRTNIPDDDAQ